jgi:death-on-curing protein
VTTDYLNLEDVLKAADAALGRPPDVRDWGLLESALGRPQATVFGEDAYPSLSEKAAALLHSLASTQALVDGNKPMAWAAMRLFCILNGRDIQCSDDEAFDLVMGLAEHRVSDVQKIAAQLHQWERSLPAGD